MFSQSLSFLYGVISLYYRWPFRVVRDLGGTVIDAYNKRVLESETVLIAIILTLIGMIPAFALQPTLSSTIILLGLNACFAASYQFLSKKRAKKQEWALSIWSYWIAHPFATFVIVMYVKYAYELVILAM